MYVKHYISSITLLALLPFVSFAQQPIFLEIGSPIHTFAYSPVNASLIAGAGESNNIDLWTLRDNSVITLQGHTDTVNSVAFSPDGRTLASSADDWTIRLWDIVLQQNTATLEHVVDRTKWTVKAVAFSPDGEIFATGCKHVKLWNVRNQTEIATLRHENYVWTLAFSSDGRLLAAGDGDRSGPGNVKVWDVSKRKAVASMEADSKYVHSVVFSSDDRLLASAGYQGIIRLWKVSDWNLRGTLQSNHGTVYSLDIAPDGKALAATGSGYVSLWGIEDGEKIVSLPGHSGWVRATAFSNDGNSLASGGDDGTLQIRNIKEHLKTLKKRDMIRSIYFVPKGSTAQQDITRKIDTLLRDVQQFYADQMQAHGFGRKTFTFETGANGMVEIHRVNARFVDRYYRRDTWRKVTEEIKEQFDLSKDTYLIAMELSNPLINNNRCGTGGFEWHGGGRAVIPASGNCFDIATTAHELGHALWIGA